MVSTHKAEQIYLHLLAHPGTMLTLPLEEGIRIREARFLENANPIPLEQKENYFTLTLPASLPDETASVIVLELDQAASELEPMKPSFN